MDTDFMEFRQIRHVGVFSYLVISCLKAMTMVLGVVSVKPEKNSIFLKKGKTVISVENRKFSRSRMMKRIAPLNSSREI